MWVIFAHSQKSMPYFCLHRSFTITLLYEAFLSCYGNVVADSDFITPETRAVSRFKSQ